MIERLEARALLAADTPLPAIAVAVTQPTTAENARKPAQFVVQRSGPQITAPLNVLIEWSGSATNGTDYRKLRAYVRFTPDKTQIPLYIRAVNDGIAEADEQVTLTLRAAKGYTLAPARSASATIFDSGGSQTPWPTAPFSGKNFEATLYPNQNGDVRLKKAITPPGDFDGYRIGYDTVGGIDIYTPGAKQIQLAFYDQPGAPAKTTDGSAGFVCQNPDKRDLYFGVRGSGPSVVEPYTLVIDGPENWSEVMPVSKKNHHASSGSDISDVSDFDFYSFKTTLAGNWIIKVIPDPPSKGKKALDAAFNVYDSAGKPVAGSYTSTIDKGGPGATESWVGVGLSAGKTYYIGVGGAGNSLGGYGVSALWLDLPEVSVQSNASPAANAATGARQFVLTRSDPGPPLRVNYILGGTAVPGRDYVHPGASVLFDEGATSAVVNIVPLAGATPGAKVVLALKAGKAYMIGSARKTGLFIGA